MRRGLHVVRQSSGPAENLRKQRVVLYRAIYLDEQNHAEVRERAALLKEQRGDGSWSVQEVNGDCTAILESQILAVMHSEECSLAKLKQVEQSARLQRKAVKDTWLVRYTVPLRHHEYDT